MPVQVLCLLHAACAAHTLLMSLCAPLRIPVQSPGAFKGISVACSRIYVCVHGYRRCVCVRVCVCVCVCVSQAPSVVIELGSWQLTPHLFQMVISTLTLIPHIRFDGFSNGLPLTDSTLRQLTQASNDPSTHAHTNRPIKILPKRVVLSDVTLYMLTQAGPNLRSFAVNTLSLTSDQQSNTDWPWAALTIDSVDVISMLKMPHPGGYSGVEGDGGSGPVVRCKTLDFTRVTQVRRKGA